MAHSFLKPALVADTAIQLLQREIVLPQLVWLNGIGDFSGKYNDTITIRVPAKTKAHRRQLRGTGAARNLVTEDLSENAIAVKLSHDVYHAVALTDEELALDITDFGSQVLNRQVRAVAEDLEQGLADTIVNADYDTNSMAVTGINAATEGELWAAFVDSRRKLNDKFVERNGRVLIVGSAFEAALLKDKQFVRYDSTGDSSNSALRDAMVGNLAGMHVVVCDSILAADAFLFHPTAFIMASRPPQAPRGASFTSSASAAGLALRWIMDYDYSQTTDRSLVDTFVGYASVEDPDEGFVRGVKMRLATTEVTVTADGNQLTATTNFGEDVTRYAKWEKVSGTGTVGDTAANYGPGTDSGEWSTVFPPGSPGYPASPEGNKGVLTGAVAGDKFKATFDGKTGNITIA